MVKFNLRKMLAAGLLSATAVFAGVATVQWGPMAVAYADDDQAQTPEETVAAPTIKIDYAQAVATITSGNASNTTKKDKFLFLEVLKDATGSKVSATYPFEVPASGEVKVDLSFLKVTKNTYLRAYGDFDMEKKSAVKTVGIQPKKVSIKYVPGSDSVLKSFQINKAEATGAVLAQYDIGTLLGGSMGLSHTPQRGYDYENIFLDSKTEASGTTYEPYNEVLNQLKITGTTLLFRQKPVLETDKADGSFIGAEVKVKIAAIPKAPKVTVDYVKGTIKLSKNVEYSLVGETKDASANDTTQVQKWIDCANGDTLEPTKIVINVKGLKDEVKSASITDPKTAKEQALEELKDGVTLMVRTKAGKKDASQVTFITLKAAPDLLDDTSKSQIAITKEDDSTQASDKVLAYKNTEKGMELTAKGASFDYLVSGTWKTVKAGKSVVLKDTTSVKVRSSGIKADTKNNIAGAFPSEPETVMVASNVPTFDKDKLMVTASKDNTLTFTSKPGDEGHTALVVGTVKYQYREKKDNNSDAYADIVSGSTKLTGGKTYEIIVAATETSRASEAVEVYLPLIAAATPSVNGLVVTVDNEHKLTFAKEEGATVYTVSITGSGVTYQYSESGKNLFQDITASTELASGKKYDIRVKESSTAGESGAAEINLP